MHSSILLSLAVGLVGLDLAVAGPCRASTVSTVDASVTSTTSIASESSTSSDTMSIDPTSLSTSTFAETSLTTSVETSTSSSAAPTVPTSFNLVASSGPATNKVLRGQNFDRNYVLFDGRYGSDVPLAFEASTGRLRAFQNLYICAIYNRQFSTTASFVTCTADSQDRPLVICKPPTGPKLDCSIPACDYVGQEVVGAPGTDDEGTTYTVYTQVCDANATPWSNFYTKTYTGASDLQWNAEIGPPGATGDSSLASIDILVQAV